jgi:RNA binding exosome subunit
MTSMEQTRDNLKFSSSEVNFVIHATEEENKTLSSIAGALSISKNRFLINQLFGHWRNKIIYFTGRFDAKETYMMASKIFASLNILDKKQLLDSLDKFIDEKGNLHIRLDKQKACQGEILLGETDSIKIKIRPLATFTRSRSIPDYKVLLHLG